MNLDKTNIFGSIRTPIGIISVQEKNKKILSLNWTNRIIEPSTPLLIKTLLKIKNYFEKKKDICSIPIKLDKTDAQIKILLAIMNIPIGRFTTYGKLAKQLNTHPRFVGYTCSINPLPLIIPCHRILSVDKKIGGYSCGKGKETKLWLLKHEKIYL
ncbi:MAG: Methylated-DNA--protein-cysteine methyltransferase, constitutive [Alphaproteobacteria bacterium MarineAlpha2_Bin1]|nr:MAG: Methylated-DNA--protein-cysteine methyltransferase, constitutive [Alphaproteobacteria bacterium MarineAlpha2_Bin1]|tara:strand:+ start:120 stop:587 length:468 start_codon:yes stop_codon:yes gene_type:complete